MTNYEPLIKTTEAFAKFENSYREKKAIDQANDEILDFDAEIANAHANFEMEIKSVGRWRQTRREQ